MPKQVMFQEGARLRLLRGVEILSNAVGVTLGPKGRNVLLQRPMGVPAVTKDGVTVARDIDLKDPFENMGAQMVREVASKTNEVAGDGTTTATILAASIFKYGLKLVTAGHNAMDLKKGIDLGVEVVVEELKKLSREVTDDSEIAQVGTISANGDTQIGAIIADAMDRVGKEGVITVEEGRTLETTLSVVEGMEFDRGYISPLFATDMERMEVVLNNPYILLFEKKISSIKNILPVLEFVRSEDRPLLVIAEDVEGEALAGLVVNKMRNLISCCAVKSPGFGDRRKEILMDLGILTKGELISEDHGIQLDRKSYTRLGQCERIIVTKNTTTIIGGIGGKEDNKEELTDRIAQLKTQISEAGSDYDREKLQERLARLAGGVAVISVGAATEIALREKKDRVEDALHATRAAVEEGILPGGGVAYMRAIPALEELKDSLSDPILKMGIDILEDALRSPLRLISINAGFGTGEIILGEVAKLDGTFGYNAATDTYEDLVLAGVVDPTKVTRTALQNAASVASLLLTTEAAVCDDPDTAAPAMPPGMGGLY